MSALTQSGHWNSHIADRKSLPARCLLLEAFGSQWMTAIADSTHTTAKSRALIVAVRRAWEVVPIRAYGEFGREVARSSSNATERKRIGVPRTG